MTCGCCTKHVPSPMQFTTLDRPDGSVVLLCPTARSNIEQLLKEYVLANGIPLGSVTKHYGKLVRTLAKEIYFDMKGLRND